MTRAIMRMALTLDARKIDRKALGPVGGAAIKLSDDADVTMGLIIGEGLKTTPAAMVFGLAPAWALGSAGGIGKFPVLPGIEALTILAETDDGGASERAILECFGRWTAAGRQVFSATSVSMGSKRAHAPRRLPRQVAKEVDCNDVSPLCKLGISRQPLNTEAELQACQIRLQAEKKAGHLSVKMKKALFASPWGEIQTGTVEGLPTIAFR